MSKIFKSSRVVLDDKAFVLSAKLNEHISPDEIIEMAATEGLKPSEAATQLIETAKHEANRILEEADFEYEQKLANAQSSSDAIVSHAYDQAKGIMEQAKAEGYQDGYNSGIEDSREIAKQIVDEALSIKEEWAQMRQEIMKDTETEMVRIVIDAIEKILD
ncbi:MAG TPA: hypothetical protein DCS67_09920 [Clostridiales bacterium UBA8960]|nr:hypothetical protein [Clostridiales bacterium UBA8960]